jgi:cellulose synthase/poly-beta-1,6-N-acetylglucosamine synthase-like glycosyltransferase
MGFQPMPHGLKIRPTITGHLIFLICYVILGPLAWLGMLAGFALGLSRMNRLMRPANLPADPPLVTILIPAKDEAERIAGSVERVLAQDYPNFEIIVIDDRSTDRTGAILDEIAAETPNLRVLHIQPGQLPSGWLGKCNALWQAQKLVNGSWLLFVDSDVSLQPEALSVAISVAVQREYDALSILTRLDCPTFLERLILPVLAAAWTVMNLTSKTNDDNSKIAAANGQFFLIRREAYEKVGGHASVKNQIVEDVQLMRHLKQAGFITRLQMGKHLAATRMHANLSQMFHGWGRIYSGTNHRGPWRILASMIFVILCGLSVYPAIAFGAILAAHGHADLLIIAAAHLAAMTLYLATTYRLSGNSMRYAWLFPMSALMMLAICVFALRMCYTGKLKWRDTQYGAELTSQ